MISIQVLPVTLRHILLCLLRDLVDVEIYIHSLARHRGIPSPDPVSTKQRKGVGSSFNFRIGSLFTLCTKGRKVYFWSSSLFGDGEGDSSEHDWASVGSARVPPRRVPRTMLQFNRWREACLLAPFLLSERECRGRLVWGLGGGRFPL